MLRKLSAGLLVLAGAVACSDSTGPENFDAVDTQTKADAVLAAFDDNEALLSLRALEGFSFAPLVQATLPVAPSALTLPASAARMRALAGAMPSFGAASPLAIFPANLLGATFVWDEQQTRYVEDQNRTGAPDNGVRVILYAVNPVTQRPLSPLNEVGYLDLLDESTPSADALRLVAVVNDVTHLDYLASAVQTQTSLTLSAEGYISNGPERVDFDLSLTLASTGLTLDYQLTHDDGSIRLTGAETGEESSQVTLTISDGDNTIALDVTFTPSTLSGTIEYNGEVVVEITGTADQPEFTRADGTPLTEQEIAALRHLGGLVETLFDHFDDLLAPALVAFALG